MSPTTVTVITPGTTANLGPGFDCLGAALTIYNRFEFSLNPEQRVKITVTGAESAAVITDQSNLLYQVFRELYQHLGQEPPGVEIKIKLGVPLARGLGSSATAIVGGLVAANYLAGNPLSQIELRDLAIAREGHPDNVVPTLLGNCQLSVPNAQSWEICSIPWHKEIIPVVAIPDFQLSTETARSVLPRQIDRSDAIFNLAHLGLLLRGLATNQGEWLSLALSDRLHQPYREALIPGYQVVRSEAIAHGAYGLVISGAGPTLLALVNASEAQKVELAIRETWQNLGIQVQVKSLALDTQGTRITESSNPSA
ncbi:homoserine kinase [Gloeocapsa sp. PCC 73106]|uniref:homoserine kinase n=1 Tax=Gloeocapsa sp. PCC 73106 TaxID=102232 RepID=UPI0002AC88D0|nr:homoserine kinase [Gloeocapsa sp. PCC 73106]ELR97708.1 homoserine kinase [Gloeocapsa sp. PCC 73106]